MPVRDAEEPVDVREVFGRELVPGEQVLWSGRPDPRRLLDATDVYVIPFSLLWGGFAIFWEILAIQAGDLVGELWGIPFVLVALYLIAGRFLFRGWKRRRTTYAVTSRRAIIVSKGWNRDVTSIYLTSVLDIGRSVRPDGIGTIRFGSSSWLGNLRDRSGLPWIFSSKQPEVPAFEAIHDVDHVYQVILRARDEARKA